jgi:quercetin dioxygenase-like cupin family protein
VAGIEVDPAATAHDAYAAPACRTSVAVATTMVRSAEVDQWLVTATLPAGTVLEWVDDHGDEALYVLDGLLEVAVDGGDGLDGLLEVAVDGGDGAGDGRGGTCPAQGAVVVEAGVRAAVTARRDSRIVHVGPASAAAPTDGPFGAPAPHGHGVHVVGPEGLGGVRDYGDTHAVWFTDGSCPTCRIMFFRVWGRAGAGGPSHSHSQGELIHVVEGDLRIGPVHVPAGSTVAIPGDRRYGFRTTDDWCFLNYRRDMSFMTVDPKQPPVMERPDGAATRAD